MKNLFVNFRLASTNVLRWWLLLVACCLCGGCASLLQAPVPAPPDSSATPQSPLAYYAWLKAAPESALQAELDTLETTLSAYTLVAAVRTSMILAATGLEDSKITQQALVLLSRAASLEATTDNDIAYKIFGDLLQSFLQERLELQTARTTNHKALTEIDSLKIRNKELEQQIEELTSIERQIIEREQLNAREP